MNRVAFLLVLLVANGLVLLLVNSILPSAYMDEVFHERQFSDIAKWIKSGCDVNFFVWDKAITTFPGLYLVSTLLTPGWVVNLGHLRAINAIVAPILIYTSIFAVKKSHLLVLSVLLFPLNYFYSFLFYTDTLSSASVLALVSLKVQKRYLWLGVMGAVSVLMRQTNIVWLFGLCLSEVIERFRKGSSSYALLLSGIIRDFYTSIFVGILFVIFVVKNDFSIVLGHQEYHSYSLHLAQINYFVLTAIGAAGPIEWWFVVKSIRKTNWCAFFVFFALAVLASEFGTVVHPFILSDNRHYSFYFNRYFLSRRWIRSVVIPAIVSLSLTHSRLFKKSIPGMHKSAFILCTLSCIIPTPLLEFRYFAIPCSLILLAKSHTRKQRLSFICFSAAVNALVMYMFLFRPFISQDELGSLSRFMF